MEIITKEDMKLIMQEEVGTALTDKGERIRLTTTLNRCPIVTFENGDKVIFNWEDIIKIASDYITEKKEKSNV